MKLLVEREFFKTSFADTLKVKACLLHNLAQETVLQTLCIQIVDLCNCCELNKIHHNVLNLCRLSDQEHVDVFSGESAAELHDCNENLIESQFGVIASVKSELNHLKALVDLWLNLHVQGDGTHKANDIYDVKRIRVF